MPDQRLQESDSVLCPNCEGRGHEGAGLLEDDYPCRSCFGMASESPRTGSSWQFDERSYGWGSEQFLSTAGAYAFIVVFFVAVWLAI